MSDEDFVKQVCEHCNRFMPTPPDKAKILVRDESFVAIAVKYAPKGSLVRHDPKISAPAVWRVVLAP